MKNDFKKTRKCPCCNSSRTIILRNKFICKKCGYINDSTVKAQFIKY